MATPAASEAAPPLSPDQQQALEQFMAVTNQDQTASVAILRRSNWSVPVAIAKFFDGEDAPLQPELERPPRPPRDSPPVNNTFAQPTIVNTFHRAMVAVERTAPARRVVPTPPAPVWRPPFLLAVLLSPFHLGYRLLAALWRVLQYLFGFVPGSSSVWPRVAAAIGLGSGNGGTSSHNTAAHSRRYYDRRRQLNPRDAAVRFKREFEETYDADKVLPFAESSYAQAYDRAKTEPTYLLVVLLSPEHDDTHSFVRETLLAPEVLDVINDPAHRIILWGGNVRDTEAYQVAAEFQCTKFPFSALVCITPKEIGGGGGSVNTRMGTVKRMLGPMPPQLYAAHLRGAVRKYADDLAAVRAVRVANETSRSIRAEQDDAYERVAGRRAAAAQLCGGRDGRGPVRLRGVPQRGSGGRGRGRGRGQRVLDGGGPAGGLHTRLPVPHRLGAAAGGTRAVRDKDAAGGHWQVGESRRGGRGGRGGRRV
ncbi:ubx domain containing protein [Niveomyces insectorum RCEF 264]|uniref:Ubx domain containing protein n=1 Tax=Niveomyces insectorum RCEF 264 TaxID=1081102 RepID=A0A167W4C7_9HYPO|nr:ubx domain containing protein [Niveomyces insectorum RCEF 264]